MEETPNTVETALTKMSEFGTITDEQAWLTCFMSRLNHLKNEDATTQQLTACAEDADYCLALFRERYPE